MKRLFGANAWSPTATADTTNLANGTYMAIAASATTSLRIGEIFIGGQASASSINIMQFARDVVVGASVAALVAPNSDGPLNGFANPFTTAVVTYVAATTAPQRSSAITAARLHLSLNTFGGIIRWAARPDEEWWITGVAVNVSESSLSAFTGGSVGNIAAHLLYEAI